MLFSRQGGNSKSVDTVGNSVHSRCLLDEKLLMNIHDAKRNWALYCYSGKAIVTKRGDLKGYNTLWLHPIGIAYISSLRRHKVTYNSTLNQGFLVHNADSNDWVFRPSKMDTLL